MSAERPGTTHGEPLHDGGVLWAGVGGGGKKPLTRVHKQALNMYAAARSPCIQSRE